MSPRDAAAVIVAGGRGSRMGGGTRKQYLEIAGVPVLLRAVCAFLDHPGIADVVVVLPPEDLGDPPPWLAPLPLRLVAGGAPGLHFYTLNLAKPTTQVLKLLRS